MKLCFDERYILNVYFLTLVYVKSSEIEPCAFAS